MMAVHKWLGRVIVSKALFCPCSNSREIFNGSFHFQLPTLG